MKGEVIRYPNWRLCGFILTGGESLTPAINFVGRVKRFANESVCDAVEGARVRRVCSVLTNAADGFT